MSQNGLKICKKTAEGIKFAVSNYLERRGRLPARVIEIMRTTARTDAEFHEFLDPEFFRGHGPAVERHG